jgi:two-component system cell cycle sensor histidine kinase/response regulator CckA
VPETNEASSPTPDPGPVLEKRAEVSPDLQAILRLTPDLYFWLGSDGTIHQHHAGRFADLALPPEKFMGRRMQDVLPPDVGYRIYGALRRVLETGSLVTIEYGLPTLGGDQSFEARLFPIGEDQVFMVVRNITERTSAQKALAEQEARLRVLIDQMPAVLWSVDRDLKFTESLGSGLPYLGLRPGQIVGTSLFEYFGTDDPEMLPIAAHRRALAGEAVSYEFRWKDRAFQSYVEPLHGAGGAIVGAVGVALDITQRVRVETALRESEERYRLLFERNLAGVFRSYLGETVHQCNEAFARIFGYESSMDVMTAPTRSFYLNEADRERFLGRLLKEKALENLLLRMRRKDGTPVWVIMNVRLQEREGAGPPLIEGTVIDITERVEAEWRLRERTAYLDALIANSPLGIVVADAAGLVTMCNPAFERTFNVRQDECAGRSIDEILAPESLREEAISLSHRVREGETVRTTTRRRRSDGKLLDVELHAVPLLADGRIIGSYGLYEDITERTALEESLRQAQRLEAVGRLAGGMAHNFNNLLTAISGYCELALMRLSESDPAKSHVAEIQKASAKASALIRQLLAFGRRQVLMPKSLDPSVIVAGMREMLRRVLGEHIEIVTPRGEGDLHVRADQGQLEQVILNLALNARDAMPRGGRLTIETARFDPAEGGPAVLAGSKPGSWVRLSVGDTGVGMDEATRRRVFEPYFTTKEIGRGTGLGLSTVHGTITQSGGIIEVQSEPDKGTTFRIYLPGVAAVSEAHSPAPAPGGRPRGTESILLVEDEEIVREVGRSALELCGYTVLTARDGRDALQIESRHEGPLDLVVTDVVMPRMSGRELVEQIKLARPGIKVLFVSGYAEDAVLQQGIELRGLAFLHKPFSLDTLAQKVREVLDAPESETR